MTRTSLTWTAARWIAGLLVVVGLALGLGTQPAAAEVLPRPTDLSLRLEPPDAYFTFKDNAATETHYRLVVCLRDDPNSCLYDWVTPVPGEGRVATRTLSGSFIVPGKAYCAKVVAERYGQDRDPQNYIHEAISDDSRIVCVDPANPPPNLGLETIGGREEQEWAVVRNQSPAYLVNLRNDGADASGTVVVDIATAGAATLAMDQAVVQPGWAAAGFTCASRPPTGDETAGLRCTGGSLKQGERTNLAILVRFTRVGFGRIHASISVSSGPAEVDTSNNLTVLSVRIY